MPKQEPLEKQRILANCKDTKIRPILLKIQLTRIMGVRTQSNQRIKSFMEMLQEEYTRAIRPSYMARVRVVTWAMETTTDGPRASKTTMAKAWTFSRMPQDMTLSQDVLHL